jgi:signal transduction histidine kinase
LPTPLTAFVTVAIAAAVGLIAIGLWRDREVVSEAGWGLIAWVGAIAIVGLVSVSAEDGPQLGLDMPLLLAAGFLFGPAVGGALAFLGYADIRELRGRISIPRALYNRAQTALSVMLASVVFVAARGDLGEWPRIGLVALLALTADCLVNYGLVVTAKALHENVRPWQVLGTLKLGSAGAFMLSYLCYGLLSVMLARIYVEIGFWGLAVFAIPVALARQAFEQSRRREIADHRLRLQSEALRDASSRVADERRDERLAVAAGLHDEVLPPLFNVHLMGQVLRQDLAAGRLLELEDDIPALLGAVDNANDAVRGLIKGLRRSPLGAAGFMGTLRLLVQHLQTISPAAFTLDIEDIEGPPLTQLLAYQVVREALNNAVRHSGATSIQVQAGVHAGAVRVIVEDDGSGFVAAKFDGDHFGLSMMRERVELVGGVLHVESTHGVGTRVVARLPLEVSKE